MELADERLVLDALGMPEDKEGTGITYAVIPGRYGPRWMIPDQPARTATALREWAPYSKTGQIAWLGTRIAAGLGLLRFLPGTRQIHVVLGGSKCLSSAQARDASILPLILVGNPSPQRKVIVLMADARGKITAVEKFPLAPGAREAIQREAEMLIWLDGRAGAPRLLSYSPETGSSTQEYLGGKMGSRSCKSGYVQLLVELTRTGKKLVIREHVARLAGTLRRRSEYVRWESPLEKLLQVAESPIDCVPAAVVHGDFAPWNLREREDGSSGLLDWEASEREGLPLQDLCHFFFMQTLLFTPKQNFYASLLENRVLRDYCRDAGISTSLVPALVAAYLGGFLLTQWRSGAPAAAAHCLTQIESFLKLHREPVAEHGIAGSA